MVREAFAFGRDQLLLTAHREILRSLCAGSAICIPSEEQRTSSLQAFMNAAVVTNAFFTPSFLRTMTPKELSTIRHIHVGGEAIDEELVATWKDHVTFVQVYGMSEGVAMIRNRSNAKNEKAGLTALSACAWVIDTCEDPEPLPVGTVGQLVIEGYSTASGYLGDAEKTEAVFGRPAWADKYDRPQDCSYVHTGDLARMESDGSFTILGRADTQVKVRRQQQRRFL